MGRIYFRNVAEIFDPSFPDTEHPNWAVHVDLWVFRLRLVVIFGKVLDAVTYDLNSNFICKPRKLSH